jgi:hypothetical protein
MEKALAAIRTWSGEQQDEAAQMLLALDRLGHAPYGASGAELAAVDEALAQTQAGQFATSADVEAALARFRK